MNTYAEDYRTSRSEKEHYIDIAIDYWSDGLPLPVDIHARLLGLGVDVAALEAQYT